MDPCDHPRTDRTATGWVCTVCGARVATPAVDASGYTPNHIPEGTRVFHILASCALILYGAIGLWFDDLPMPTKRGRFVHFHGVSAWLMFSAMIACCANLLSVVVDHYDRRNNETDYRWFAQVAAVIGWSLLVVACIVWLIQGGNPKP